MSNTTNAETMLVTAVRIQIKPEKRDEFLKNLALVEEPTRAEPGCLSYGFYQDPKVENAFLFIEEWKNQDAFDFHIQTPYVKAYMEKFPTWLDEKASARAYEINKLTIMEVEPVAR